MPKPLYVRTYSGACMVATDLLDLVIVDAGPLIHLDELGCLDHIKPALLDEVIAQVKVPGQ